MLRIGLIGAGGHALGQHAPALRQCAEQAEFRGRVDLTGVCDVDRARAAGAAEESGFRRAYDSIDAMLPQVDAVMLIVPAAAMVAALEPILRHDRPVLIEKPLGRDLNEARRLAVTLEGRPHMVSLNRRFDPGVQLAKRWLAKQSSPRALLATMTRRDRSEDNFAWGTSIHLTDLLCFLHGPLKLTRGRRDALNRLGVFSGDGDFRGTLHIRPSAGRVEESVRISGDDWYAVIETGTHQPWKVLCCGHNAVEVSATSDPTTPEFVRNGTADETAAFLRGVLSGDLQGPTVADAMPGTELAAALQALDGPAAYHESLE